MINLSTIQEQGLLPDIIDDTNPDDVFVGFFRFDKSTNPNYCLIKRIVKENGVTRIMYPNGQFDYSCNWENRAAYSYRHRDFPFISVKYGYLYNWYAATDNKNIANSGWRVPEIADFTTLETFGGGYTVAGGGLKETGLTHWLSPNTGATNELGFNARGSGITMYPDSTFYGIQRFAQYWSVSEYTPINAAYIAALEYLSASFNTTQYSLKKQANSIRLIKENSENPGIYLGNDGRAYHTVKIGNQVWLADNLAETKYRNGDTIPTITYSDLWKNITTGAKCAYNNDESNV